MTSNFTFQAFRVIRRVAALLAIAGAAMAVAVPDALADASKGSVKPMKFTPATPVEGSEPNGPDPSLKLGPGDAVTVQVYGRPEMTTTTYVADDGNITVPLAGQVKVNGMSPAQAADRVEKALKDGEFMLRPDVTIQLQQHRSQQVSVLGEVKTPGRVSVESRITVVDLLAQAGGTTENASDVVFVLRPDGHGSIDRIPVALNGLRDRNGDTESPMMRLKGGDSVFVPRADQFYIYGEVHSPNMYRLEPGMTVIQAIARGGGVTPRGSDSRIEITRRRGDGKIEKLSVDPTDVVEANDVIRVKERIF
ncbi:MAG TPA: SLBB domain-containing protein [Candidatus Binatia bacterium]|nr:SLBB domain-containing protein [Candidatus Binatia bacterium]